LDESYQDYINRVARLTLPGACSMQLQTIQQSPKFVDGKAMSFPGYSVITPPSVEDLANKSFYSRVETVQQQLSQQLEADLVIPLPLESFHLTIADLIWDDTYRRVTKENPDFEHELREQVAVSFKQYQEEVGKIAPLAWQLWGIVVRPRAVMACLVPKDQDSYESIIKLRRTLYQNAGLIGLGIEQQYDLTAHITLGYFGNVPAEINRDRLCVTLSQINDYLVESEIPTFTIERAELRKFENMIDYTRESDWATVEFN